MISGGLGAATHPRTLTHTHAHTNIHTHRAGDLEAADVDEDFIMAIEYGMPPTAGVRMHAERGARGWGGVRGGEREDVAARQRHGNRSSSCSCSISNVEMSSIYV